MKLTDCINKEYESIKESVIAPLLTSPPSKNEKKLLEAYHSFIRNPARITSFSDNQCGRTETTYKAAKNEIGRSFNQYNGLGFYSHNNSLEYVSFGCEKFPLTPKDVKNFSIRIMGFQNNVTLCSTGIFLSSLINLIHFYGPKKERKKGRYEIYSPIDGKYPLLGLMNNGAHITVFGDCDYRIGSHMEKGTIIINGNVTDLLGHEMRGGKIIVTGNADGNWIGDYSRSGEIHINGIFKLHSPHVYAKVYHNNERIITET